MTTSTGRPRNPPRAIAAGLFKSKCLALLDQVARTKQGLVVTKRGKPVARVVPLDDGADALEGSILHQDDLISPVEEGW